ncbi:hypothetical protein GN956_G68 [Arapaima gigas]
MHALTTTQTDPPRERRRRAPAGRDERGLRAAAETGEGATALRSPRRVTDRLSPSSTSALSLSSLVQLRLLSLASQQLKRRACRAVPCRAVEGRGVGVTFRCGGPFSSPSFKDRLQTAAKPHLDKCLLEMDGQKTDVNSL